MPTIIEWARGTLAKDTVTLTVGTGLRTAVQAITFVIVARVLGVGSFGACGAILAIASSLGILSGFGISTLMLRETARRPENYLLRWRQTLGALALISPLLLILYGATTWAALPSSIPRFAIVMFGFSELVLAPLMAVSIHAYQAHGRMGRSARIALAQPVPRFVSALLLLPTAAWLPSEQRMAAWSCLYTVAAFATAAYSLMLVRRDLSGHLRPQVAGLLGALRECWPFAINGAANRIYADIDKVMLASQATLETTGVYSVATRFADMATIPLFSFFSAATPKFFQKGEHGIAHSLRYASAVAPLPLIYACCCGLIFWFFSGVIPWVLGDRYAMATDILKCLFLLPLFCTIRRLVQTAASAAGRQSLSVAVVIFGMILNALVNLWAIPKWGWIAAVVSTYAAELAMTFILVVAVFRYADGGESIRT
jgi:O-antigen/teichoic acid export membrane protein